MTETKKHQCRWFRSRYCWQKSKTVKKSECTPCLVALLIRARFGQKPFKMKKFPYLLKDGKRFVTVE